MNRYPRYFIYKSDTVSSKANKEVSYYKVMDKYTIRWLDTKTKVFHYSNKFCNISELEQDDEIIEIDLPELSLIV